MNEASPDFTWLFVKMMAGLILVLILAFVLIRYLLPKGWRIRGRKGDWGKLVARFPIETRKGLYVVKVLERFFLLGGTDHSLNLVSELTKEEGERIAGEK